MKDQDGESFGAQLFYSIWSTARTEKEGKVNLVDQSKFR